MANFGDLRQTGIDTFLGVFNRQNPNLYKMDDSYWQNARTLALQGGNDRQTAMMDNLEQTLAQRGIDPNSPMAEALKTNIEIQGLKTASNAGLQLEMAKAEQEYKGAVQSMQDALRFYQITGSLDAQRAAAAAANRARMLALKMQYANMEFNNRLKAYGLLSGMLNTTNNMTQQYWQNNWNNWYAKEQLANQAAGQSAQGTASFFSGLGNLINTGLNMYNMYHGGYSGTSPSYGSGSNYDITIPEWHPSYVGGY